MRPACLFLTLTAAALTSNSALADDDYEAKQAEMVKRLRVAKPEKDYEVAAKQANDKLVALLGTADRMELFRLDPNPDPARPGPPHPPFHKYAVTGRTAVGAADARKELVTSLGNELHWYEGWKAACFNPRHGLRAVVGKDTLDLVICFECHQMEVYRNGTREGTIVLLGGEWAAADKLLRAADETGSGASKK